MVYSLIFTKLKFPSRFFHPFISLPVSLFLSLSHTHARTYTHTVTHHLDPYEEREGDQEVDRHGHSVHRHQLFNL